MIIRFSEEKDKQKEINRKQRILDCDTTILKLLNLKLRLLELDDDNLTKGISEEKVLKKQNIPNNQKR